MSRLTFHDSDEPFIPSRFPLQLLWEPSFCLFILGPCPLENDFSDTGNQVHFASSVCPGPGVCEGDNLKRHLTSLLPQAPQVYGSSEPRATQPSGCCLSSRLSFHLCKLVVAVAQLTGCRGVEAPSAWWVPRRPSGNDSCLIIIPFKLGTSSVLLNSVRLLSRPHMVGTE